MTVATSKQTWAIFCATGYDVRPCNLTKEEASTLIEAAKGDSFIPPTGAIKKHSKIIPKASDYTWQKVWDKAHAAGMAALEAHTPTPMAVQQHENMADDSSPVVRNYLVKGGVCGFAWIKVKPATQPFARWLKGTVPSTDRAYGGGYNIWVREGGQSYERKMAYASAFARVLNEHGVKAYANGRLD